jgi:hypothetical protein
VSIIVLGISSSGHVGSAGFKPSYHPFRSGTQVALLFTSSGPVGLDTLIPPNSGFTITHATAINDSGQAFAIPQTAAERGGAVLLNPK